MSRTESRAKGITVKFSNLISQQINRQFHALNQHDWNEEYFQGVEKELPLKLEKEKKSQGLCVFIYDTS